MLAKSYEHFRESAWAGHSSAAAPLRSRLLFALHTAWSFKPKRGFGWRCKRAMLSVCPEYLKGAADLWSSDPGQSRLGSRCSGCTPCKGGRLIRRTAHHSKGGPGQSASRLCCQYATATALLNRSRSLRLLFDSSIVQPSYFSGLACPCSFDVTIEQLGWHVPSLCWVWRRKRGRSARRRGCACLTCTGKDQALPPLQRSTYSLSC